MKEENKLKFKMAIV